MSLWLSPMGMKDTHQKVLNFTIMTPQKFIVFLHSVDQPVAILKSPFMERTTEVLDLEKLFVSLI